MVWLITAGAMLGYSAYAYAVRTLPTATVATYGYVNPVVAVILGASLLHEPVTWNIVAGGAAVIASVVLILLGSASQSPNEIVPTRRPQRDAEITGGGFDVREGLGALRLADAAHLAEAGDRAAHVRRVG